MVKPRQARHVPYPHHGRVLRHHQAPRSPNRRLQIQPCIATLPLQPSAPPPHTILHTWGVCAVIAGGVVGVVARAPPAPPTAEPATASTAPATAPPSPCTDMKCEEVKINRGHISMTKQASQERPSLGHKTLESPPRLRLILKGPPLTPQALLDPATSSASASAFFRLSCSSGVSLTKGCSSSSGQPRRSEGFLFNRPWGMKGGRGEGLRGGARSGDEKASCASKEGGLRMSPLGHHLGARIGPPCKRGESD